MLMATIMFSDAGLSAYTRQDMYCLVEAEEIFIFTAEKRPMQCTRTEDDAGTAVWALNMMLANHEGSYGELLVKLQGYK